MKNSFLRTLYPFIVIYLTMIVLFIAFLMFIAVLPPTDKFQRNMKRSANYLSKDGEYPKIGQILLDNYSDSIILNIAYNFDARKPFLSAMNAEYYFISEVGEKGTAGLSKLVNGDKSSLQQTSYGRYWFGQSALIRLFMYIWNAKRIYSLFSSVFLVLSMIAFVLTWNRVGKYQAFVLAIVLSFCNYYCFSLSFQYSPPVLLGLGGLIFMLMQPQFSWRLPSFFALGMLTAYFDLLTAPILSFGIPALVLSGTDANRQNGITEKYKIWIGYPLVWGMGYGISWGTKILLTQFCSGDITALEQVFLHLSTSCRGKEISRISALSQNFNEFYENSTILLLLCIICASFLCLYGFYKIWKKQYFFDYTVLSGYLWLALIPILVILTMANHAYIHSYMSYRGFAITGGALLMLFSAFQPRMESLN